MSFLGRLFGSKTSSNLAPIDLSLFGTDLHSHIIPGIDDGARDIDSSIAMLAKFESLGFSKVITTPHIMSDLYRNTSEIILSGLDSVKEVSAKLNLNIEIEAAAEYYFDESFLDRLKKKEKLLTFGDNYVLFEFSFHSEPQQVEKLFFELLSQGYKPVLAHFERYLFLNGNIDRAYKWREEGINIQLNLNSITGHYGPQALEQAEKLVDSGQLDFVGSDCHRMENLMLLESKLNLPYFHKLVNLDLKNKTL
jgi:tyrosine-protein phosphatase YwqE